MHKGKDRKRQKCEAQKREKGQEGETLITPNAPWLCSLCSLGGHRLDLSGGEGRPKEMVKKNPGKIPRTQLPLGLYSFWLGGNARVPHWGKEVYSGWVDHGTLWVPFTPSKPTQLPIAPQSWISYGPLWAIKDEHPQDTYKCPMGGWGPHNPVFCARGDNLSWQEAPFVSCLTHSPPFTLCLMR